MKFRTIIFLIACWIIPLSDAWSQTVVKGYVRDVTTRKPLPYVTILVSHTSQSTQTNDSGYFEIDIENDAFGSLQFLLSGYLTVDAQFNKDMEQTMEVDMESLSTELEGVVIRGKKSKYRNKNNPAVELIRKVIDHKEENRTRKIAPYIQMKSYEKLNIGATNLPKIITKNPIFRPFRFVFDNYDTTAYPGLKTFIIYIDESWSDVYVKRDPDFTKKIVNDRKRISFDPKFINEEGTVAMLKHLYQDIDVYDNHFLLVTNNFKSPISDAGPTYYKYFIDDTTIIDGKRYVRLYFTPRNTSDLLLKGHIQIAIDEQYAVKHIFMEIDKSTNINFVQELSVEMNFEKNEKGKFYLEFMENDVQFSLLFKGKRRMTGNRTVVYSDYAEPPHLDDSLFTNPPIQEKEHYEALSEDTYARMRPIPFTRYEIKTYENLDSIKKMKYYHRLIDWSSALFSGYKNFGLVEAGNLYRIYSYNPAEGHRFRMGLQTNPVLSRRYFVSGYLAYGTLDRQLKHYLGLTWSIPNQRIYDYPMHYFRLSSQYDVKVPGRVLETNVQDNITENIQRGVNNKFIYTHTLMAEYNVEFSKNFLLTADGAYLEQKPGGSLYFIRREDAVSDTIPGITSNKLGLQLRWAPGEKFYNDRTQRTTQFNKAPVFVLRGDFGFKDILNGDFDYQKLSFEMNKRWFLGSFGNLDTRIRANYLWGNLPYPLLNIPRANQTYTFSTGSYNLMNNGEFVSDKQIELHINYRMFGFILNKIPLLKRLQLREAAGIKMIYGGLSDINNPYINPNAMPFPTDDAGNSYIYTFQKNLPYMEWNVGIENIFKILRIEYVRRITYLDHPNVSPHRIQFSIVYDF